MALASLSEVYSSSKELSWDSLVGGVCKEQGRIHREMVTHDYYAFRIHKDELQSLILGKTHFVKFR